MSEETQRTAEDVRNTIAMLQRLLAEIDPRAAIASRGHLHFGRLGLSLIFGANAGNCGGGCFGCSGCNGCTGCDDTASSALAGFGAEVINPNPARLAGPNRGG
jgi:hypothetical protein